MPNRSAFTLIELLVIIAIMGIMVTVGVMSITAGQGAARVKGATRDIFGSIRHARSVALVTQQPAIITYSTVHEDGEVMAKIELTTAKLLDTSTDRSKIQTLSGEPLKDEGRELVHIEGAEAEPVTKTKKGEKGDTSTDANKDSGDSIEDILFAPIKPDVVKGMRLKVVKGDELPDLQQDAPRKNKISVFSNVDYLLGKFSKYKAAEAKKKEDAAAESSSSTDASADEDQEEVSIVWETNGRVEPHQVWVYPDGKKPEDGLLIRIDRFGAAKVVRGDGKEDD